MRFDDWQHYPPRSRARSVEGGIKASSQRGQFAGTWWAKRWIEVLESFDIGSRLQRGRSYARKGQVLSIEVRKGGVEARVQGSRRDPYSVQIKIRSLPQSEWKRLAEQLSTQARFAAKLLAGEMPADIEGAFRSAGFSLFPEKARELSTACSCPDSSNPCKHVAAVYYLLGEAFDRDPFLIFRLRGIDRDEFIGLLGDRSRTEPQIAVEAEPTPEPPPSDPAAFWSKPQMPPGLLAGIESRGRAAALPRRLGNLPFWRGAQPLPDALEPTYERAVGKGESLVSTPQP